jgi:hypothetical protein
MDSRKISVYFCIFALVSTIMACTLNIGGPDYPTPAIPVSTEAMGDLQSSLETAVAEGVISGQVMLSFTEAQLTSYLYYNLQTQSEFLISNPQVFLRDGQLQIYGTASESYFAARIRIILSAGVDDQGQLIIDLTSVDFGPMPIPIGLKEIITSTIQEAFTGAFGPVATGIRVQSVAIADGTMTIIGKTK